MSGSRFPNNPYFQKTGCQNPPSNSNSVDITPIYGPPPVMMPGSIPIPPGTTVQHHGMYGSYSQSVCIHGMQSGCNNCHGHHHDNHGHGHHDSNHHGHGHHNKW